MFSEEDNFPPPANGAGLGPRGVRALMPGCAWPLWLVSVRGRLISSSFSLCLQTLDKTPPVIGFCSATLKSVAPTKRGGTRTYTVTPHATDNCKLATLQVRMMRCSWAKIRGGGGGAF